MPWWQAKQDWLPAEETGDIRVHEVGKAALISYLRREYIARGRDPRRSNLYIAGTASEANVRFALSDDEMPF